MANPSAVKLEQNDEDFSKRLHSALIDRILSKRCRACGVVRNKTSLLSNVLEIYMLDIGVVGLVHLQCRSCYKVDTLAASCEALLDDLPDEMKVRPAMSDIAANHALIEHNETLHDLLELMLVAATDDEDIRREQHTGMATFMFENARRVCEEWCRGELAELRHLKYLRLRSETLLTLTQIPSNISPEYVEMYLMMSRTFSAHRDKVLILLDLIKETLFNNPTPHSFMMWVMVAMMHVERYADFKRDYCGAGGDDLMLDKGELDSVVERYLTLEMPIGVKKIPVVFVLFELPRFYHYVKLLGKTLGALPKVYLNRSQSASYRSIDSRAEMNPSGLGRVKKAGVLVWPQKQLDELNQKNEEEQRNFYERRHSDDESEELEGGATKGKPPASGKIPAFLRRKGWEPHFRKDLLPPPPPTLVPSIQLDPASTMVKYASSVPNPLDAYGRPREKRTIIVATVDTETLKRQGYHLDGSYDKATIITSEDGTTILEGTATAEDIQACVSRDYDVYAHQEGTGYLTFQPESAKGPTRLASVAKGYADPRQGLEGCLTQHGLAGRGRDTTPRYSDPPRSASQCASQCTSAASSRQSDLNQLRKKLREKQKALRSGKKPKPSQTLLSYTGLDSTSAGYLAIPFNPLVDGPLGAHVMGAVDQLKEQTRQHKKQQKRNKYKERSPSPPPDPGACEKGFASPSLSEAFKKTNHAAVKAYVLNKDMNLMNMLDDKGLMMPVEDEGENKMEYTFDEGGFEAKNRIKKSMEAKTSDMPSSYYDGEERKRAWSPPPRSRDSWSSRMMASSYPIPFHDREEAKTPSSYYDGEERKRAWSPPSSRDSRASRMMKSSYPIPFHDREEEEALRDLEMRHYEREGLERNEGAKKKKKKKKKTKKKNAGENPANEAKDSATEARDHVTNTKDTDSPANGKVTVPSALSSPSGGGAVTLKEEVPSSKLAHVKGGRVEVEVGAATEACTTKLSSCSLSSESYNPSTSPLPNSRKMTARAKFKECENCHTEKLDRIRVCSACKRVAYCNSDCQKEHWKTHKQTCSYYLKKDVTG